MTISERIAEAIKTSIREGDERSDWVCPFLRIEATEISRKNGFPVRMAYVVQLAELTAELIEEPHDPR